MLVFGILLPAASRRAAENDLCRALSAQIRATLADYDPDCRQFGLLAFRSDMIDPAVFRDTLPASMRETGCDWSFSAPLTEAAVLDSQIIRYMKARLPLVYADVLASRLAGLYGHLPLASVAAVQTDDATSERPVTDLVSSGFSFGQILETALADLSSTQLQHAADSLFGEAMDSIGDQLLTGIRDSYRSFASDVAGVSSDAAIEDILGRHDDFLQPDSLTDLAGHVDALLNFKTAPVYEKLCLVEYVLGQFRPAVQTVKVDGCTQDLLTIDGRRFVDFSDDRLFEVEQILTQAETPQSAHQTTRAILAGLRSIIWLVCILTDQNQMNDLRTWATVLSGVIAVASNGMTVVDPEPLSFVLAAGKALGGGLTDCDRLLGGEGVDLWPGETQFNLKLYYQDYLRLMLMVLPRATLVRHAGEQLDKILPDGCYTAIHVSAQWRGATYALESSYLGTIPEVDNK